MPTIQIAHTGDDETRYTRLAATPRVDPTFGMVGWNTSPVHNAGVGLRFQNIAIAQGSSVSAATLTVTAQEGRPNLTVNSRISGHDADDVTQFDGSVADYDAKYAVRTTAVVDWDNVPAFVVDTEYTSPDFASVIEEIVGRPGWASGKNLLVFWEDHEGRSTPEVTWTSRRIYDYSETAAKSAKLNVTFTPPGGAPQMIIINMI